MLPGILSNIIRVTVFATANISFFFINSQHFLEEFDKQYLLDEPKKISKRLKSGDQAGQKEGSLQPNHLSG